MINVALRFDDPSITSDHKLEFEVIKICARYGVKINLAVIPFKSIQKTIHPLTSIAAKHMIDAEKKGWIEISQHGYSHQKYKPSPAGPSEFKHRPFKEQLNLLSEGKDLLDGIFKTKKRGFVPPWNTFDSNTMLAAKELDFDFISAGWETPYNLKEHNIMVLPRTGQVSDLINDAKRFKPYSALSPIIISVMHHYDFIESNENNPKFSLHEFEEIIKSITSMKHVRVTSLSNISKNLTSKNIIFGHNTHKLLAEKFNWRVKKHLPNSLLFHNSLKMHL